MFDGILTSLLSIVKSCDDELNVFVFTMDLQFIEPDYTPIHEGMNKIFNAVLHKTNANSRCTVIDLTAEYKNDMTKITIGKRFTPYALLRLYSENCSLLPDKILYLDTDTLAIKNIAELYNTDIENYEIAGSRDYFGRFFKNKNYLNSGVMLMNLQKIRQTGLLNRARQMCIYRKMFLADQNAINRCVKNKLILEDKFNHQRRFYPDTVIRHYCTSFRFFPIFHLKNVKPYEVEKVLKDKRNVYNNAVVREILHDYTALKKNLKISVLRKYLRPTLLAIYLR